MQVRELSRRESEDRLNSRESHAGARSRRWVVVADYGVFSLTNFIAGLVVARSADLATFGLFGILFLLASFVMVVVRASLGETWLITKDEDDDLQARGRALISLAFVVGLILAAAQLLIMNVVPVTPGSRALVVVMAAVLPGMLAKDATRFVAFKTGAPQKALGTDVCWLVVQTILAGAITVGWLPSSAAWAAATWVIGTYAGLLLAGGVALDLSSVREGYRWWRTHRTTSAELVVESATMGALGPVIAIAVAAVASQETVGVLRGAAVLFNPMLVLAQAVRTALVTRQGDRLTSTLYRTFLMMSCIGWGWMLLGAPGVGRLALGDLWGPEIRAVIMLEAISRIGMASMAIDSATLRLRQKTRRSAGLGIMTCALAAGFTVLGAGLAGTRGAAVGSAVGFGVSAVVWLRVGYERAGEQTNAPG